MSRFITRPRHLLYVASLAIALSSVVVSSCAHARHLAVVVDASFSTAVFALDDAELAACQQHVLSPAQCAAADPKIKAALVDVQAVTKSLQATPHDAAVPKNLPDLLKNLSDVRAILAPAAAVPQAAPVVSQAQRALDLAIAVVRQFAGGQ